MDLSRSTSLQNGKSYKLMLGKRLNYSCIQTFLQIRNDEPSEN